MLCRIPGSCGPDAIAGGDLIARQQGAKTDYFAPAVEPNRVKICLGINDLGGAMLRLTFLLCSGLFLLLLLGGRDFGQLRPGLAQAEAETEPLVVTARVPAVETVTLAVVAPVVAPEPSPEPVVVASVAAPVVPAAAVAMVAPVPVPAEPENTVFTLSDFADPAPVAVAPVAAEQAAQGEIWYVAGNSLNVRAGPSTSDEVIGKLTRGEAALVVWREGDDWARIRIEGDGIEGYVAMRFLSSTAPSIN